MPCKRFETWVCKIKHNRSSQVELSRMIHVCGDLHGQYHDLLHILEAKGEPCEANQYLINGDIVDRGPQSLQCIVLLLAWQVADPASIFLNRGNHEAEAMNLKDGFHAELMEKYGDPVLFDLFQEVFSWMPAATLVDSKVFVTHGGLSSIPDLSLDDIRGLPRGRGLQPEESPLLTDLLWSDPLTVGRGTRDSSRGVGVVFGQVLQSIVPHIFYLTIPRTSQKLSWNKTGCSVWCEATRRLGRDATSAIRDVSQYSRHPTGEREFLVVSSLFTRWKMNQRS